MLAHAERACHHDLGQYAHPKNTPDTLSDRGVGMSGEVR